MKQIYVEPGELHVNYMPYSEVMMHMRIAGKAMPFILLSHGSYGHSVQLMDPTIPNMPYSSPVLPGEAGLYFDEHTKRFYFNREE